MVLGKLKRFVKFMGSCKIRADETQARIYGCCVVVDVDALHRLPEQARHVTAELLLFYHRAAEFVQQAKAGTPR